MRVGQADDRAAHRFEFTALPTVANGELFVRDGVVESVANAGLPGNEQPVRFGALLSFRGHRPFTPPE